MLSSQDRSAMICFLDGWSRSPPYLPLLCKFLHRWILALPPMLLPILCLYKAHQRMYFRFWICTLQGSGQGISRSQEKSPHYESEFRHHLIANIQKLPIKSKNIFSFDRILTRHLNTLFWLHPNCLAYSLSDLSSK